MQERGNQLHKLSSDLSGLGNCLGSLFGLVFLLGQQANTATSSLGEVFEPSQKLFQETKSWCAPGTLPSTGKAGLTLLPR